MKKFAWLSLLLSFGLWFGGCAQDTDTGLGTDTGSSTVTDVEPGTDAAPAAEVHGSRDDRAGNHSAERGTGSRSARSG